MSLESIFHFTQADLEANKRGEISPDQSVSNWNEFRLDVFAPIFLLIVLSFLTAAFFTWEGYQWGGFIGVVVIAGLIVFFIRRMRPDESHGKPLSVTGPVSFVPIDNDLPGPDHRDYQYTMVIDYVEFPVPKEAVDELEEGATYTVYYLPKSHAILSLERAA
ncbi:MAG: hypothetical protein L0154_16605 [Chloroflexi bacterium]|nr:hypothetical protein [Chloroflexota bacterium]